MCFDCGVAVVLLRGRRGELIGGIEGGSLCVSSGVYVRDSCCFAEDWESYNSVCLLQELVGGFCARISGLGN